MKELNLLFSKFKQCIKLAPLPVTSLFVYMGLPSTQIFPYSGKLQQLWHSAYLGWYDFLLAYSILIFLTMGLLKFEPKDLFFLLSLLLVIALSFLNGLHLGFEYILDTTVYLFRFFLTFFLAKALVYRLGTETTESLIIALFILLSFSALFVYKQRFGDFNRIYAAGMSVASFSQVTTVALFISIMRKYSLIMAISLLFLLLSFSRSSLLIFLLLFGIFSLRKLPIFTTLKIYSAIAFLAAIAIWGLLNFGGDGFVSLIAARTDTDSISTLNARTEIWEHALRIFESESIPLFGVGFHATPYLIESTNLRFVNSQGVVDAFVSFHNILIEYAFGLGIASLFIFYCLIKRTWQTFCHHCYPSFFIFAFFLISQTLDFTFFLPKEVIIWSLMLGLAEGQWRFDRE